MTGKPIARVGDIHVCPIHPPNAIINGKSTIKVNGRDIATVGSKTGCGATIISGVPHVLGMGDDVAHIGSKTSHGGVIMSGSPDNFVNTGSNDGSGDSAVDLVAGGIKELVNQFVKAQAALSAQWMSDQGIVTYKDSDTGETLTNDDIAQRYRNEGKITLPLKGSEQQAGADAVRDAPQTPAIISAATAITSRGRSVARNPEQIAKEVKNAVTDTRSPSEAIGKAGMNQAKQRQIMETDSRFIDRYHGPDDMVRDKHNKLTEIEAKGNNIDSTSVAKNRALEKQGSADKNLRRANQMLAKAKKVGKASNRQGGAYTQSELDLWGDVALKTGKKRHTSTHTNTETGRVKVVERDNEGYVSGTIDDFKMEDFESIKKGIEEYFKK